MILRIFGLKLRGMLLHRLVEQLRSQIKDDVASHLAWRREEDPRLQCDRLLGGSLHVVTGDYPVVSLDIVFLDGNAPTWADVEYGQVAEFGTPKHWKRKIKIGLEDNNHHYLTYDGKRFNSMPDLSRELLNPLVDH